MKALKIVGYTMAVIQLMVTIALIYLVMTSGLIPVLYGIIGATILVAIPLGLLIMVKKGSKKLCITEIIISLVLSAILGVGCYFVGVANKAIDNVTGNTTETDEINVYVGSDDAVTSVNEAVANGYLFGTVNTVDANSIQETINDINAEVNAEIKTEGYDSIYAAIGAFENGRINGIIANKGTIVTLDSSEDYHG